MDHFAGLDVSVKDTSVCIVDGAGKITREVRVASEPAALLAVFVVAMGIQCACRSRLAGRHMRAVLKAQIQDGS
jgi:hypothetical protein